MAIRIRRLNDSVLMEAENEQGNRIALDGSAEVGGVDGGFRPMELLLAACGACSTIDIVGILKKQRQPLEDITIGVDAERRRLETYSEFTEIRLHYELFGSLDADKVAKAIELSVQKYCSVSKMLEKTAQIKTSFTIHPASQKG